MTKAKGHKDHSHPGERRKKRSYQTDMRIIRRIARSFRPYRLQVFLVLIAILATTALGLVNPLMVRLFFDEALKNHNLNLLLIFIAIMVITPILIGIISIVQTYLSNIVGLRVMRDYRNQLYKHLQNMQMSFFTSTRTGEIQSRLSNDVNGAQNVITDTTTKIITNVSTAISACIAMLYISPLLTVISLGLLPVFLWITYKVGTARRLISKETQQSLASLTALMQETLSVSGILLVKTFGRQDFSQDQFSEENQRLTDLGVRQQMIGRWFLMIINTFFAITPAIVYLIGGLQILLNSSHPGISLGGIIAFTLLQTKLFIPIGQLLLVQVEVQGALALFDRIFEYLDLPTEIADAPDAISLASKDVSGKVVFKNVSFSYKDTYNREGLAHTSTHADELEALIRPTLKNISFTIQPGQLVALVGPSGAGKSTITHLVPRLYDVESGVLEIDGYDIKQIALKSLSSIVGVVTQETYLFHASIRTNLLYANPAASEEEMIAAAQAAAIHERIMELSDGYDTMVGERGYKLSGGEKQRVAIARVLLKNPRILILDEATSALDTHSERLIQAALEPLMKSRTTLAIAHRLSTVISADLIIVVDHGEIVERGTHYELLALGGLYARLYHEQFTHHSNLETSSTL